MALLRKSLVSLVVLLPSLAKADNLPPNGTAVAGIGSGNHLSTATVAPVNVAAAIEPASFLLVGFGMLGGAALRGKLQLQEREGQQNGQDASI